MRSAIDELSREQLVALCRALCAEVDCLTEEVDAGRVRLRNHAAAYAAEWSPLETVRYDVVRALRG